MLLTEKTSKNKSKTRLQYIALHCTVMLISISVKTAIMAMVVLLFFHPAVVITGSGATVSV